MKRICPILAIAGLLISGCAKTTAPSDLEVSCAVAANIELGRAPKDTEAWSNAATLALFYLGRLSGLDDQTHWGAKIKGLVEGRHGEPYPEALIKQCVDLFHQKLE
jgi:hypothetical protein